MYCLYSPVSNTESEIPHEQLQLVRQCRDAIIREYSLIVQAILPRLHKHNDIIVSYAPSSTYLVHLAVWCGCTDVTKKLTSIYNCDPTRKDCNGWTTLHIAARWNHLSIVQHLIGNCGCAVSDRDNSGWTPLHIAADSGHLAIVQYLIGNCGCAVSDRDDRGRIPLHYAAQYGYLATVQYLVQCSGTDVAIATDEDGATPLHLACQHNYLNRNIPVIKYLLSIPVVLNFFNNKDSNSTLELNNETAAIFNKYETIQISHPVGSFVNIFLLGDTGAGKTSLCRVLKERSELHIKDSELVQGVKTHTAGIVPNLLREDKSLGNVIVHDFAGQPEYYSSHTAVLESLLQSSGAVFVVLINLTQDQLQQVGRWSSIVLNETQKVSSECHLIVIASHADQVEQELRRKLLELEGHVLRQFTVAGHSDASLQVFPLDCRLRWSHTLHSFVESLSQSCRSIRNKQSPAITLYCNFLYSILEAKVSEDNVCMLEKLKSLCDQSRQEDVPLPDDIVPLLKTLHSSGLIVYLENEEDLEKSWIILRKEILLAEVDGILFAPSGFKEHRDIFSNTGIITSSALKRQFPCYSPNMLITFLQSMKLCEALDTSLLEVTNLTLRQEDSLQVSDQLLFFPALIAEERPQDMKGHFKSGWCLKVVSRFSFSVRFLHILLLHLAYEYSVAVSSRDRPWVVEGSERGCSVWINGIHWYSNSGVEAMVEQTESGQCVAVLVSCEEGAEEEMVKLHFELMKIIANLQEKYCPKLECKGYLLSPCEFQYPMDRASDLKCHDIELLKSQISQNKPYILSTTAGKKPSKITELLPIEPKRYLTIYKVSQSDHTPHHHTLCRRLWRECVMMVAMVMVEEVVSKAYTCLQYNHVISPGGVSTAPVVSTSDLTSSTVEQRGEVIGTLQYVLTISTGPTDRTIAYNVLKKNQFKIMSSDVDVFLLAASLSGRDAISEALYQRTIDRHTGLSTTERLVQLVSSVINAVKVSGGEYFDKLLQSLRECGQERLADELYQCYSECISSYCHCIE